MSLFFQPLWLVLQNRSTRTEKRQHFPSDLCGGRNGESLCGWWHAKNVLVTSGHPFRDTWFDIITAVRFLNFSSPQCRSASCVIIAIVSVVSVAAAAAAAAEAFGYAQQGRFVLCVGREGCHNSVSGSGCKQ